MAHRTDRSLNLLTLLVAAVAWSPTLGCFVDDERDPMASATMSTTAGDTSTTAGSTATTLATSVDTTMSSDTRVTSDSSDGTSDPTTTNPTTDPTSATTDATGGGCAEPECTPGQEEIGEDCGTCGYDHRSCQNDCTWSSWTCLDNSSLCDIWILDGNLSEWKGLRIEAAGGADHAPKDSIHFAFDIEQLKHGYVATQSTYHVLNLDTMTWIDSGDRGDLFPEIEGSTALAAYAINDIESPPSTAEDSITIQRSGLAEVYRFRVNDQLITHDQTVECCPDWGPEEYAPATPTSVRAWWLSLNEYPWTIDDTLICEMEMIPLPRFAAGVFGSDVHVQDVGTCFEFIQTDPFGEYEPFTLPDAPPSATVVGGAFWYDGLYIFREGIG